MDVALELLVNVALRTLLMIAAVLFFIAAGMTLMAAFTYSDSSKFTPAVADAFFVGSLAAFTIEVSAMIACFVVCHVLSEMAKAKIIREMEIERERY